jgi:hypothetical protein
MGVKESRDYVSYSGQHTNNVKRIICYEPGKSLKK